MNAWALQQAKGAIYNEHGLPYVLDIPDANSALSFIRQCPDDGRSYKIMVNVQHDCVSYSYELYENQING